MPRDHARLLVSIWADDDWKALSAAAQWMYMLLTSQPNITVAGTLSMTVTRWSGFAYGMTPHAARTAVLELEIAGRVLVDERTEELGLPLFFDESGLANQPNMRRAALKALERVESEPLRSAMSASLSAADATIGKRHRPKPGPGMLSRTRRAVFERDNWACQYCGRRMEAATDDERSGRKAPTDGWDFLELDHVEPYSLGGKFTEDNLVAACSPCNRSKGATPVEARR